MYHLYIFLVRLHTNKQLSLAYMELFIGLAHIFRKFRFQLYETDKSDVVAIHDFFLPSPKMDSKGVRVKVIDVEK